MSISPNGLRPIRVVLLIFYLQWISTVSGVSEALNNGAGWNNWSNYSHFIRVLMSHMSSLQSLQKFTRYSISSAYTYNIIQQFHFKKACPTYLTVCHYMPLALVMFILNSPAGQAVLTLLYYLILPSQKSICISLSLKCTVLHRRTSAGRQPTWEGKKEKEQRLCRTEQATILKTK